MYIDPGVAKALADADPDAKDYSELTPEQAREAMETMVDGMLPPVAVDLVQDLVVPTAAGDVVARLYRADPSAAGPLLLFFHGGGWQVGTLDIYDRPVRRLAVDSGAAVLAVDYRLAPEHPFPAGLDDCYAVTAWARENLDQLGADGSFLAVGGESAGANLAAAVAQRSRDEGGPLIDHQLLLFPVVARDFDTESYRTLGEGYFLSRASMRSFWDRYVGPDARPRYADLFACGSLSGLPEATVITCGLDPLRDEGEQYAERLAEAGVPVTLTRVYGLVHGSWLMDACGDRAYQFGLDAAGALRRAAARMSRT